MIFVKGDKVIVFESGKYLFGTIVKQVMPYHGVRYNGDEISYFVHVEDNLPEKRTNSYTKKDLEMWTKMWNRNAQLSNLNL